MLATLALVNLQWVKNARYVAYMLRKNYISRKHVIFKYAEVLYYFADNNLQIIINLIYKLLYQLDYNVLYFYSN